MKMTTMLLNVGESSDSV